MIEMKTDVVLIAGPTASGKSALGIELANRMDGIIINTDSMQVYEGLRLITARPSAEEEAAADHHLYGYRDPSQAFSVGQWLADVKALLAQPELAERPWIFVGGTGLYFNALLGDLSIIPEPDPEIRAVLRTRMSDEGALALWHELKALDQAGAEALRNNDAQRIVRALEVVQTTGKPLAYWQAHKGVPLVKPSIDRQIWLNPDRDVLRARIRQRFEKMVHEGAVEEVESFLERQLDPQLPVMKAIGLPEIRDFLSQQSTLDEAVEKASIASSQYAKRQRTWFRGQFSSPWREFDQNIEQLL